MDTASPPSFSSTDERRRRLHFRAWHRGTREADYLMGCFFDANQAGWNETELDWFEALLNEEDPDVMGWVMGTQAPPARFTGPLMDALRALDFVSIPR